MRAIGAGTGRHAARLFPKMVRFNGEDTGAPSHRQIQHTWGLDDYQSLHILIFKIFVVLIEEIFIVVEVFLVIEEIFVFFLV